MAGATAEKTRSAGATGPHGAAELPSVIVTSYNLEIRDEDGFVGDKASRSAFVEHLDALRQHLKKNGDDPLKGKTAEISKKELDALLNFRPGPALRHELAHGKLGWNAFFSDEAISACWLVYLLTVSPLLRYWDSHVAPAIAAMTPSGEI